MQAADLTTRAMLVEFTAKRWGTRRQDRALARELAESKAIAKDAVSAGLRLARREFTDPLDKVYNGASQTHRELSQPWSDKGARVLASAGYDHYKAAMRAHEDQWWSAVDTLVGQRDQIIAAARIDLNGSFNPADYPSPARMRELFVFGTNVYPFPDPADFRISLSQTDADMIRAQLEATILERVAAAGAETWQRLYAVVEHMIERLKAYQGAIDEGAEYMRKGSFHETLVENIRELVAAMPGLNVTGDPKVSEFTRRIAFELTKYNAGTLKASHDKRAETLAAAEAIAASMAEFIA